MNPPGEAHLVDSDSQSRIVTEHAVYLPQRMRGSSRAVAIAD